MSDAGRPDEAAQRVAVSAPSGPPVAFEQSLARLEAIVERLQRDDVPLEEALTLFKEGTELTTHCDELLSKAELRIQELTAAVHERFAGYQAESSYEAVEEEPF